MKLTQPVFIDILNQLGIDVDQNIAHGFQMMWVQFMCSGRKKEFFDLLEPITNSNTFVEIVSFINSEQNIKLKNFFEDMALYQDPCQFDWELQQIYSQQHIDSISQKLHTRLSSLSVINHIALQTVYRQSYLFNKKSLINFLNELKSKLIHLQQFPLAILLSNDIHTISISWCENLKAWSICDVKYGSRSNFVNNPKSSEDLAKDIFAALFDNLKRSCGFNITIITDKNYDFKKFNIIKFLTNFKAKSCTSVSLAQHNNSRALSIINMANFRFYDASSKSNPVHLLNSNTTGVRLVLTGLNHANQLKPQRINSISSNQLHTPRAYFTDDYKLDLHGACILDQPMIVRRLLYYPLNPNQLNTKGESPLHIACLHGSNNATSILLSHPQLSINQLNQNEKTPLHIACQMNHLVIVENLLNHPDINPNAVDAVDGFGFTSLDYACLDGNLMLVQLLLTHKKTDLNRINPFFELQPIWLAYYRDNRAIVDYLTHYNNTVLKTLSPIETALNRDSAAQMVVIPQNKTRFGSYIHSISESFFSKFNSKMRTTAQESPILSTSVPNPIAGNSSQLIAIQNAVETAQKNYSAWYNGAKLRGANGFFSFLRHGNYGQQQALSLIQSIKDDNSDGEQAITLINDFLAAKDTRYHRHSYASFLLDQLGKIEQSCWSELTCDVQTNRYAKCDVIHHLPVPKFI